jgi:hypothetical protein
MSILVKDYKFEEKYFSSQGIKQRFHAYKADCQILTNKIWPLKA